MKVGMVFKQPDPTKCHCSDALNFGEPAPDCPDCGGTGKPPEKEAEKPDGPKCQGCGGVIDMGEATEDVPPNTNEIRGYIHCKLCNEEGARPPMLMIGRTPYGYQVWCRRHDCNVVHIGIRETGEVILNESRAARPEDNAPTPGEATVRPPSRPVPPLLDKLDEVLAESWKASKVNKAPRVFMNVATYAYLRKFRRDRLDFNTRTEMIKLGWQGTLYQPEFDPEPADQEDFLSGLPIWVSRFIPVGSIFIDTSDGHGPLTEAPDMLKLIRLEEAS